MNKLLMFTLLLLDGIKGMAQEVEMADDFRGEGKIYVVVAVVLLILLTLLYVLMRLDRRLSKLEREQEEI